MRPIISFLLLTSCLLTHSLHAYPAKVVGISDGDTCTVLTESKEQIKIRFAGIDTPESKQAFGTKAKQALSGKIFGREVEVKVQTKDRYGRTVADIYLGDRWINFEMVKDGFAWHYKQYSKDKQLADAETKARAAGIGLWSDPSPTPPWDFRKGERTYSDTNRPQAVEGGYWLNTGSNTRHNMKCNYFNNTKQGRPSEKDEGKACGYCGG